MMATVPHVTSGSGLRKFQADRFLFDRVYMVTSISERRTSSKFRVEEMSLRLPKHINS